MYIALWACVLGAVVAFRLAFPVYPLPFLAFVALVPILQIERYSYIGKLKKTYSYLWIWLSFTLINWSILNWSFADTPIGSTILCIGNGFCMSLPVFLFSLMHKRLALWWGESKVYGVFVCFWISVEYTRFYGDFAFPWLTLGNCFATLPNVIQWYAFTGVLGGSLWIVVCNVWLFLFFQKLLPMQARNIAVFSGIVIVPIALSVLLQYISHTQKETKEALIIHPAMKRYGSHAVNPFLQIDTYMALIEKHIRPSTGLVLLPETAFQAKNWLHLLDAHLPTQNIRNLIKMHPHVHVVTGVITCEYTKKEFETKKEVGTERYYKTYNNIMQIDASNTLQMRSKEKLVPYEERRPYYLRWFDSVYFYFGGEDWYYTYPDKKQANTFQIPFSKGNILPLICYEAVFYEFVSQKIDKNTQYITCSANEIWYHNTEGADQAFLLCKILAVCTGKSIVRSSDFGVSALIDYQGNTVISTNKAKADVLKVQVPINHQTTFYCLYGDIVGKIALLLSGLLTFSFFIFPKKSRS